MTTTANNKQFDIEKAIQAWEAGRDHQGYAVGGENDDINLLPGMALVVRANSDDAIALYIDDRDRLVAVGDVGGPWAVDVDHVAVSIQDQALDLDELCSEPISDPLLVARHLIQLGPHPLIWLAVRGIVSQADPEVGGVIQAYYDDHRAKWEGPWSERALDWDPDGEVKARLRDIDWSSKDLGYFEEELETIASWWRELWGLEDEAWSASFRWPTQDEIDRGHVPQVYVGTETSGVWLSFDEDDDLIIEDENRRIAWGGDEVRVEVFRHWATTKDLVGWSMLDGQWEALLEVE